MRDFIAVCTLLACLAVFIASVIAIFRPLPRFGLSNRKHALRGIGLAFGLFVITVIIIPAPDKTESTPTDAPKPVVETTSGVKATQNNLTDEQQGIVTLVRLAVMQTVMCNSAVDLAQDEIDKTAAGKARPIDAYEEVKRTLAACDGAVEELSRSDLYDGMKRAQAELGQRAFNFCSQAAAKRKAAMQTAQEILDGDDRLSAASTYLELKRKADSDETLCRFELLGLAENYEIPEREVDFAKIGR